MKNINLVFDMDGTIADFYNVAGWLDSLNEQDTKPYSDAKPLFDFETFNRIIDLIKQPELLSVTVSIITWTSKNSTDSFHRAVAYTKKQWLRQNNFNYDYIRCTRYGVDKNRTAKQFKNFDEQILFDDNEEILNGWEHGRHYNPKEVNILDILKEI